MRTFSATKCKQNISASLQAEYRKKKESLHRCNNSSCPLLSTPNPLSLSNQTRNGRVRHTCALISKSNHAAILLSCANKTSNNAWVRQKRQQLLQWCLNLLGAAGEGVSRVVCFLDERHSGMVVASFSPPRQKQEQRGPGPVDGVNEIAPHSSDTMTPGGRLRDSASSPIFSFFGLSFPWVPRGWRSPFP